MWTLTSARVSGLVGTLVGMARVARSEVASDVPVPDDAHDLPSAAPVAPGPGSGRLVRPPRPREGEVDDAAGEGESPNVHDGLIDAAQESAALEASSADVVAVDVVAVDVVAVDVAAVDLVAVDAGQGAGPASRAALTDRERAMLEFERFWWRHAGSKEQAIRETFDLSATHYYRLLNALLDQPAAVEFDPLVVGRLRRLRASRARRRSSR
jgi:hypothetical protein